MFTVLFIDDDPAITSVAKEVFICNNINCIICDSYNCAVLTINNCKLGVIVTDIQLKEEKTGVDIILYLKSRNINIPVIVTTGHGDEYDKQISKFDVFTLKKPYFLTQLIEKINEIKNK